MLRIDSRLSALALLVGLLAACSGPGAGSGAEPSVAAIAGTRPSSASSASEADLHAQRPFIRPDATEEEKTALYAEWTDCLRENGARPGASPKEVMVDAIRPRSAKGKAMAKACLAKQPESLEEREERTDPALFKEHNLAMYQCAKAKGYKLTAPDEKTGQFGLTEITALGDFGSPGIVECQKEAFGIK